MARLEQSIQRMDTPCGTPGYCPQPNMQAFPVEIRSYVGQLRDVFEMGVTNFIVITGVNIDELVNFETNRNWIDEYQEYWNSSTNPSFWDFLTNRLPVVIRNISQSEVLVKNYIHDIQNVSTKYANTAAQDYFNRVLNLNAEERMSLEDALEYFQQLDDGTLQITVPNAERSDTCSSLTSEECQILSDVSRASFSSIPERAAIGRVNHNYWKILKNIANWFILLVLLALIIFA